MDALSDTPCGSSAQRLVWEWLVGCSQSKLAMRLMHSQIQIRVLTFIQSRDVATMQSLYQMGPTLAIPAAPVVTEILADIYFKGQRVFHVKLEIRGGYCAARNIEFISSSNVTDMTTTAFGRAVPIEMFREIVQVPV